MSFFPVMCVASGQCVAFPDVCITPGVLAGAPGPIPYPSIAIPADGDGTSKVKTENSNTLRKGDKMSKSSGDNAGTLGGIVSRMFMGTVGVATGSNKVKAVGKEVAYHTVIMKHNGGNPNNPAGGHILPTNVKVKVVGTPGCPGSSLDALKNGKLIAVGGLIAGGVGTVSGTGDPVTDAQDSLRCAPSVQQGIGQMQNPATNPRAGTFNLSYGGGTLYNPNTSAITLGPSWATHGTPAGLTGIISHEMGHATSHLNGTSPGQHMNPLPGERQGAYVNRMTNENLREEGRAAQHNIKARQEAQKNCPNQTPPEINGDNGNFQNASQQPDPQGALGNEFGRGVPDLDPRQGYPPGTNYQQYYSGESLKLAQHFRLPI